LLPLRLLLLLKLLHLECMLLRQLLCLLLMLLLKLLFTRFIGLLSGLLLARQFLLLLRPLLLGRLLCTLLLLRGCLLLLRGCLLLLRPLLLGCLLRALLLLLLGRLLCALLLRGLFLARRIRLLLFQLLMREFLLLLNSQSLLFLLRLQLLLLLQMRAFEHGVCHARGGGLRHRGKLVRMHGNGRRTWATTVARHRRRRRPLLRRLANGSAGSWRESARLDRSDGGRKSNRRHPGRLAALNLPDLVDRQRFSLVRPNRLFTLLESGLRRRRRSARDDRARLHAGGRLGGNQPPRAEHGLFRGHGCRRESAHRRAGQLALIHPRQIPRHRLRAAEGLRGG
jgi:hypothetical protein